MGELVWDVGYRGSSPKLLEVWESVHVGKEPGASSTPCGPLDVVGGGQL